MNAPTPKLNIKAIKTEVCYFIQTWDDNRYSYSESRLDNYYFDDEKPLPTHNKNWVKIKSAPKKIEKDVSRPNINHRYELIDKSMKSDKFPLVFQREQVAFYSEEDYHWIWKPEFKHLYSLYAEVSDKQEDIKESLEFEFNIICKIDNIKEYAGFKYQGCNDISWGKSKTIEITPLNVQYQVIDKIVFPDIILPSRPSQLSSHDSYKIVQEYVRNNINPKYAKIDSDHNFCFSVQKRITLAEPISYESNVGTSKRPRYIKKYRNERDVRIFEMTHAGDNYKGYTCIKGFEGKNHEDLKKNIDTYLKNLIEKINAPIKDCSCCAGTGIILDKI